MFKIDRIFSQIEQNWQFCSNTDFEGLRKISNENKWALNLHPLGKSEERCPLS